MSTVNLRGPRGLLALTSFVLLTGCAPAKFITDNQSSIEAVLGIKDEEAHASQTSSSSASGAHHDHGGSWNDHDDSGHDDDHYEREDRHGGRGRGGKHSRRGRGHGHGHWDDGCGCEIPRPTPTPRPSPTPIPVPDVIESCEEAARKGAIVTTNQVIRFDDTRTESGREQVCQFGVGDNLDQKGEYLRARYEQASSLQLPANAVICDMGVLVTRQSFLYDDVFYLTYNGVILASNLARSIPKTTSESVILGSQPVALHRYAWPDVRDLVFTGATETREDYCLGAEQGLSSCQWPLSQQTGTIAFNFDREITIALSQRPVAGQQRFGFVITGDNDPQSDCYHERLDMNLSVKYFIKR